jgi:dTDP-L-rhamnose 4-epimerase
MSAGRDGVFHGTARGRIVTQRVLVTGGAGFIGSHAVLALARRGYDVRVLDRRRPDAVPADLVVGDIRDAKVVDGALVGVDVVCHLAAKVGLGVSVQDLPGYASVNDHGMAVLLAGMARAGVGRLVLASSMVVYGEGRARCAVHGEVSPGARSPAALDRGEFEPPCPRCGRPLAPALVTEDVALDPRNAYAVSKVAQEHYAASWARAVGGQVIALRFHNVYGPGMPRDTPYAGVAAIFTSALLRGEPPRVLEDGGQRRDFVHVHDVAEAVAVAAESSPAWEVTEPWRAYNVGSGVPHTVADLAVALRAAIGGPAPVITGEYRLGDVRHITADSTRLKAELPWAPTVAFESGVADLATHLAGGTDRRSAGGEG